MTFSLIKGLANLFAHIRQPIPSWDLNLILNALMRPPFELLAECCRLHLSMETSFLIIIMSASKAGELVALLSDPSYTRFYWDKMTLCPIFVFSPRSPLISPGHAIPIFYPSHTTPRRKLVYTFWLLEELMFYLERI